MYLINFILFLSKIVILGESKEIERKFKKKKPFNKNVLIKKEINKIHFKQMLRS